MFLLKSSLQTWRAFLQNARSASARPKLPQSNKLRQKHDKQLIQLAATFQFDSEASVSPRGVPSVCGMSISGEFTDIYKATRSKRRELFSCFETVLSQNTHCCFRTARCFKTLVTVLKRGCFKTLLCFETVGPVLRQSCLETAFRVSKRGGQT